MFTFISVCQRVITEVRDLNNQMTTNENVQTQKYCQPWQGDGDLNLQLQCASISLLSENSALSMKKVWECNKF